MREAKTKDLDVFAQWVVGTAALPARLRGGVKHAKASCSLTDLQRSETYFLYNVRMVLPYAVISGRCIALRGEYNSGNLKHEYEDGDLDEGYETKERLTELADKVKGFNKNLDVKVQGSELIVKSKFGS